MPTTTRPTLALALTLLLTATGLAAAAGPARTYPYLGSIAARQARMRMGPARSYPASWLYQRADLPVRVLATFKEWRKVEDPDGTTGWILANLVSDRRTAIVRGAQPVAMLERPVPGARLLWRAAPGVVGRLSQCGSGWCRFDVKGQAGYVETGALWGVAPGETLP